MNRKIYSLTRATRVRAIALKIIIEHSDHYCGATCPDWGETAKRGERMAQRHEALIR